MDKRYFGEFIYLLSGMRKMQRLYWKMSEGNKEMYKYLFHKNLFK